MEPKWEIIEDWFVKSPICFFHIMQTEYFHLMGERLLIAFHGNTMQFTMSSIESAKELFDFLVDLKIHYVKSAKAEDKLNQEMRAAALDIQNKMAGHVIGGNHA